VIDGRDRRAGFSKRIVAVFATNGYQKPRDVTLAVDHPPASHAHSSPCGSSCREIVVGGPEPRSACAATTIGDTMFGQYFDG
jgi:hypothetical protein